MPIAKEQNEKGVLSKANVIVLGVSPTEDRNSYAKYQARTKYYELLKSTKDYDIEQVEAIKAGKLVGPVRIERQPDGYEKLIPVYTDKTKKSKDADGKLRIYIDGSYETLPQTCTQCRFAHDLNMKLFSCDEDFESIIYCDKRECICKAERPACDWAAFDVK